MLWAKICLFVIQEGKKFALGAGGTPRACWEHIRREDNEYMFLIRLVLAFGWLKNRYTDVFLGGCHEIHANIRGFCRDFFPIAAAP